MSKCPSEAYGEAMPTETIGGEAPPTPERAIVRKTRAPTKFPLPSERIPFELHFEVLRRFQTATGNGKEAVPATAVEGGGLRQQAAQLNTGFLTAVGLLTEDERGKFKPSQEAIAFLVTRSANEDRARPILRALLEAQWFTETAKIVLASKPVVSEQELCQELAIAAATDASRKGGAMKVLVDYLAYSGIVRRTEQGLVLGPLPLVTPPAAAPAERVQPESRTGTPVPHVVFRPPQIALGVQPQPMPPGVTIGFGIAPVPGTMLAWRTIQTDDFLIRIRPDLAVIADARDHLDLLEKKLRQAKERPDAAVTGGKP